MATIDNNGVLHDYQGNTWDWELRFFADEQGQVPQDISGWLLIFGLKEECNDPDVDALVLVKHVAGSGPNDDPTSGIVFLQVASDITKLVPVNTVPYTYTIKRAIPRLPDAPLVETLEVGKMLVDCQVIDADAL